MTNIYAPLMRALVVVALVLATATLCYCGIRAGHAPPFNDITQTAETFERGLRRLFCTK